MAARPTRPERCPERLWAEMRRPTHELEDRVARRTRELAEANKKLEELAHTDHLTQVLNGRGIDLVAARELDRRKRYQAPISLRLVDIDRFKQINTRYLHTGGNKALADLAKTPTSSLRTADHL